MTEPQHPESPPEPMTPGSATTPSPTEPLAPADSPTRAWPSLATPAAASAPGTEPTSAAAASWEPADRLPDNHVGRVGETGTFGAASDAPPTGRARSLRWAIALVGISLVAAVSFAVVSLVGGKPPTSVAMGYMPADAVSYSEFRLDLPGDQRQKLASFMKPIPGFDDSSQFDTKLNELFDRIVALASHDQQTWTADIAPWFGGQVAMGSSIPTSAGAMSASSTGLFVVTVKDRAKAIAWLEKTAGDLATFNRTTYGDADLLIAGATQFAIGVDDKVMLAGSTVAVKAAIDTGGKSAWAANDDVEAALATVDRDYVMVSVTRLKAMADAVVQLMAQQSPGALDKTQIDDTILPMLPAWFANSGRFENDEFVATSVSPAGKLGYDTANHADGIVTHIPASTLLVSTEHDAGPTLNALLARFRPLPEAKDFFTQLDQAMSLLGGFDAVVGWWGDTGLVVSKLDDGTIGGGLVVKPRDAAAADRLFSTLTGFVQLGGSSAGVTSRTVDHNGTKVTVVDLTAATVGSTPLPAGYKAEIAWAANADIAVVGYGEAFVNAVLDAGPGHSLADDARFKGLLDRVGSENIALTFLDIKAVRTLLEPLAQANAPADAWTQYTKYIQPYLQPIDALISSGRKDGSNDRGVTVITTPR